MDKPKEFGFLEQQQPKKDLTERKIISEHFQEDCLVHSQENADMWKNSIGPNFAIICL